MSLKQILDSGQFALTAEITPPVSCALSDLLAKVAPLKGLADAVNVTDGAGARAHLESTIAASALLNRGDDPKVGDQPEAKPVFDLDAADLAATAVSIRDLGRLPNGRAVGGSAHFYIGVADAPVDPAEGWAPSRLIKKVESGARFAQTQFCMDPAILRRYATRLADHGLGTRLHLLVGVVPLASAKSARWIKSHLIGSIIPD